MLHRFILEPYKQGGRNRYTCPVCDKRREFARYIDTEGEILFPPEVGKCNRVDRCGYHFTPKDYFNAQPVAFKDRSFHNSKPTKQPFMNKVAAQTSSFIDPEIVRKSQNPTAPNAFRTFLESLFHVDLTAHLFDLYGVGSSKHWQGATVFWQTDYEGRIRAGKIMLYNAATGRRVKQPFNHIQWAHTVMKLPDFKLVQCFFGEHLLVRFPEKPVGIVESEKTALVCAAHAPEMVWLATSGKNGCRWTDPDVFSVLRSRKITLYPDLGAFDDWKAKAQTLSKILSQPIGVSNHLEKICTETERANGWDLADFFIEQRDDGFGWALSDENYPLFWDFEFTHPATDKGNGAFGRYSISLHLQPSPTTHSHGVKHSAFLNFEQTQPTPSPVGVCLNSDGGTGFGSTHSPNLASLADL